MFRITSLGTIAALMIGLPAAARVQTAPPVTPTVPDRRGVSAPAAPQPEAGSEQVAATAAAPAAESAKVPCPAPSEMVKVTEVSSLAKDTGSAVGGTAAQIAGAVALGPIGAAAAGVLGAHVGKKAASKVKTVKTVEARKLRPDCKDGG